MSKACHTKTGGGVDDFFEKLGLNRRREMGGEKTLSLNGMSPVEKADSRMNKRTRS